MKRAPLFVFAGTVAGLAGILSFHTQPAASSLAGSAASAGTGANGAGTGTGKAGKTQSASSSRATGTGTIKSITGATEQYGYGQLAVKITVRGGHIVNVAVPLLQTAEPYSQQLAGQVIPTLRSEVLSAQSARINGISGATYTCEAYAASVQAALDKLHQA